MEIRVPDIGDYKDVPVIEVHIKAGDTVAKEAPLITLETDKATMDIPSPVDGTVTSVSISVGDSISEGTVIAVVESAEAEASADAPAPAGASEATGLETAEKSAAAPVSGPVGGATPAETAPAPAEKPVEQAADAPAADGTVHATPLVRRLARDLEVDLGGVKGSGPRGRVTKQDLLAAYGGGGAGSTGGAPTGGAGIPPVPVVDFAKFGPVREVPLSRIKKLSGPALHRSWLNVPHVTHADDADITELDAWRKELDTAAKAEGYRVTLLAFLLKAAAATLRKYPEVNSSLAGDHLVLKDYCHIGVAVDTEGGLVVPVIRDVDRKGITELSHELADLSERARDGKLTGADLQGASFTISSLGGIGGTHFTPIVNAPEVAILGVVRSKMAPVWDGTEFQPRLMLPLCLSYDHRVVDGALAARFTAHLAGLLGDARKLVL